MVAYLRMVGCSLFFEILFGREGTLVGPVGDARLQVTSNTADRLAASAFIPETRGSCTTPLLPFVDLPCPPRHHRQRSPRPPQHPVQRSLLQPVRHNPTIGVTEDHPHHCTCTPIPNQIYVLPHYLLTLSSLASCSLFYVYSSRTRGLCWMWRRFCSAPPLRPRKKKNDDPPSLPPSLPYP